MRGWGLTLAVLGWIGSIYGADGLFPVVRDGQSGFMDAAGKVVIAPRFDDVLGFSDGLAAVLRDGKFGFIDRDGKYVIGELPSDVLTVNPFSGGLAVFAEEVDGQVRYGYLDTAGRIAIPCRYRQAYPFSEKAAVVQGDNEQFGVIDAAGDVILPMQYQYMDWGFSEGRLVVQRLSPEPWQVLDRDFREVFSLDGIDFLDGFHDGRAIVVRGDKYGFVDLQGDLAVDNLYEYAWPFSEGLASVSTDAGCGYIDGGGKVVIPFVFQNAMSFSEGLAAVSKDGQWGFIDKTGRWVIEARYAGADNFKNGLALVTTDLGQAYIDPQGRVVYAF